MEVEGQMEVEMRAVGPDGAVRTTSMWVACGRGAIAPDEPLKQRMRKLLQTPAGRERLRRRSRIEHRLSHVTRRQGRRARYRGIRKNLFALRRAATIHNLQVLQRKLEPLRKAA